MNSALIRYFQCIRNKGIQSAQKEKQKNHTYKETNDDQSIYFGNTPFSRRVDE